MFILRDLLKPLQDEFPTTDLGHERARWLVYTLLATIVPFTSSRTSNLLRTLETLFNLRIGRRRFYTFMASPTLPWVRLWRVVWHSIPAPLTDDRVLVALDDFINPKVGRKIFGCETIFDHAAKANQAQYPWAQNIVAIGLLKRIKGRWACLPLAFRFYLPKKAIEAETVNMKKGGHVSPFYTKLAQAAVMLQEVAAHFVDTPVVAVTDSWFGNNGLLKPMREVGGSRFHLLSRLRSNAALYALPPTRKAKQRGRPRKYGQKLGSVADRAVTLRDLAKTYTVNLYGKSREVRATDQVVMLKSLRCPVRVVWVFRKTRYVALFTTDLDLSVTQIIEFYGARWKIESGFKELKQDIGSQSSQTRNAHAVTNHLQFCMMAATLTWIYADRLKPDPERRHKVKGRASFAFSDVRRLIAEAALAEDFARVWPQLLIPQQKSFVAAPLRMAA
jgi:hypothetical protein